MTKNEIPDSMKEIIDVFIRFNFRPLNYKVVSEILRKDINTIVQRFNRNPEYFDILNEKPKIFKLKKGMKEIVLHRDKYQCQICKKNFEINDLVLKYKDPYMKDKDDWDNIITSCINCKDEQLIKKLRTKRIEKQATLGIQQWEYKEILIRRVEKNAPNLYAQYFLKIEMENQGEHEEYLEFDEINEQGWFHIINDNNEISSKSVADILNYFGNEGWELILLKELPKNPDNPIEYNCFFKRIKKRG